MPRSIGAPSSFSVAPQRSFRVRDLAVPNSRTVPETAIAWPASAMATSSSATTIGASPTGTQAPTETNPESGAIARYSVSSAPSVSPPFDRRNSSIQPCHATSAPETPISVSLPSTMFLPLSVAGVTVPVPIFLPLRNRLKLVPLNTNAKCTQSSSAPLRSMVTTSASPPFAPVTRKLDPSDCISMPQPSASVRAALR